MNKTIVKPSKLRGFITPPGDKSISHRSAIFNAIADGTSHITNYGTGADLQSTLRVLRSLGVDIKKTGDFIRVVGGNFHEPSNVLNTGNSGTTTRLMAGVLAGQNFLSVMNGDKSIRSRPMARIVEPLRAMGANIEGREDGKLCPLIFKKSNLHGIKYDMPIASAQVKSALLLAALYADSPTVIHQPALSRDHTELMFRAMGASIFEDGLSIEIKPGRLKALDVKIPADISSAAYWMVAAICHNDAEVTIQNVGINPTRTGIIDVLKLMGASLDINNVRTEGGEQVADITARSSDLNSVVIEGNLIPRLIDEIPIIALAACFAKGTTTIRNAEELRTKESDRITAMCRELTRLGASVNETDDGLVIFGGNHLTGGTHQSYGDHRVAMTLGVAGLISRGKVIVQNSDTASISYPAFWDDLELLGVP